MSDVFLLKHTPDIERIVAIAAKVCYSTFKIDKIDENLKDEEIPKFIDLIMNLGHFSVLEHANFTFGLYCSRACSHQLVRHRISSFSQRSQRYVEENQFEFYIPKSIKESEFINDYKKLMINIQEFYNKMKNILNEDKRYILPNACKTDLVFTMNVRELLHVFNVRCCSRAQSEIKYLFMKILYLVRQIAPNIFKKAGPNCLNGKCPEGKMSCGKMEEIKEIFFNNDKLIEVATNGCKENES